MKENMELECKDLVIDRDVEVDCEFDHERYHSIVTMGLNKQNKIDLTELRAQSTLRDSISSNGKDLKNKIAELCDKCREVLPSGR